MKAQIIQPNSDVVPLPKVTDEELLELQQSCSEIARRGGEAGKIAADIMRISSKLRELSERAERALAAD
ncbi:MAG: hypothetical protein ABL907_06715 [Hyphomicrobium sp.]